MSFAEIKALATGNPYIKEKMELDIEVAKLKVLKANHNANIYRLENQIVHEYPLKISTEKSTIQYLKEDWNYYQLNQIRDPEHFDMVVEDVHYNEKESAGKAVLMAAKKVKSKMSRESVEIGSYQGFTMAVRYNHLTETYNVKLQHRMSYLTEIGENGVGNIIRINNVLDNIPKRIARSEQNLQTVESQLEDAKVEVQKPFSKEADLKEKNERLSELNALLNMDETNSPVIEEEQIEEQQIVEGINKLQSRDNVPKFGTLDFSSSLGDSSNLFSMFCDFFISFLLFANICRSSSSVGLGSASKLRYKKSFSSISQTFILLSVFSASLLKSYIFFINHLKFRFTFDCSIGHCFRVIYNTYRMFIPLLSCKFFRFFPGRCIKWKVFPIHYWVLLFNKNYAILPLHSLHFTWTHQSPSSSLIIQA